MRARRTLTKAERTQLGQLPRRESFTLQGTMRDLPFTLEEDGQSVTPLLVLWMDGQAGTVRVSEVINATSSPDQGASEALELLLRAISAPAAMSGVELPASGDEEREDESGGCRAGFECRRIWADRQGRNSHDRHLAW